MLPKHRIIATATAIAVAAARHSPPLQSRLLCGFVVAADVVIVIGTAVTTVSPALSCDLFDCCVCSVVVSSPLPHLVVAIPPTASTIVIVVIVIIVVVIIIIVDVVVVVVVIVVVIVVIIVIITAVATIFPPLLCDLLIVVL